MGLLQSPSTLPSLSRQVEVENPIKLYPSLHEKLHVSPKFDDLMHVVLPFSGALSVEQIIAINNIHTIYLNV